MLITGSPVPGSALPPVPPPDPPVPVPLPEPSPPGTVGQPGMVCLANLPVYRVCVNDLPVSFLRASVVLRSTLTTGR